MIYPLVQGLELNSKFIMLEFNSMKMKVQYFLFFYF